MIRIGLVLTVVTVLANCAASTQDRDARDQGYRICGPNFYAELQQQNVIRKPGEYVKCRGVVSGEIDAVQWIKKELAEPERTLLVLAEAHPSARDVSNRYYGN